MSEQLDLSQNLELRDAAGHTVGIVLPPKIAHHLTAERDQLRSEVGRLDAEVAELRQALEVARQELRDKVAIMAERDRYLQALEEMWAEKIADADKNGKEFGELLAEIESDLNERGMLDAK